MRLEILGRLKQRKRLAEVARELDLPYTYVQRIARASSVKYVGRRLDPQQIAEVKRLRVQEGLSIRLIARQMNLPKSKIGRACKSMHDKVVDGGGTAVRPMKTKEPMRCPEHGLLTIWPCVACAAMRQRRLEQNRQ